MKTITAPSVLALKGERKISCITAADFPTGQIADAAGVDMVLVGDSLAMVVLGHPDTLSVTMDEMIHHTKAVKRGVQRALVIGDMPFLSFQGGIDRAVLNAGRFLKEGGAGAVKLEGGGEVAPVVKAISEAGIPVMGHIGLTPQHVARMGGWKYQGKTAEAAAELVQDAVALAEAGCFAVVLECMPDEVSEAVTEACPVPTIGIGAGPHTDGQVLVMHDVLGMFDRFRPKFVKTYAEVRKTAIEAVSQFAEEIRSGTFPDAERTTFMDPEEADRFRTLLKD